MATKSTGTSHDPGCAPITFAVCSNNSYRVSANTIRNSTQLGPNDLLLIVFDTEIESPVSLIARELRSRGLLVIFSSSPGGLSIARNLAIGAARTRYLVFIDDDVIVSRSAVEELRAAFQMCNHVVGARLVPQPGITLARWFISPSQFHYLGIHRDDAPGKIWGACMGFDLNFVREHGLQFRIDLGRKGRSLISGEDTSFVSKCFQFHARESFLERTRVHHDIAPNRLTFLYMLRRVFSQGRSEVRRGYTRFGAVKEWKRNIFGWQKAPLRTFSLAVFYLAVIVLGMAVELARLKGKPPGAKPISETVPPANKNAMCETKAEGLSAGRSTA